MHKEAFVLVVHAECFQDLPLGASWPILRRGAGHRDVTILELGSDNDGVVRVTFPVHGFRERVGVLREHAFMIVDNLVNLAQRLPGKTIRLLNLVQGVVLRRRELADVMTERLFFPFHVGADNVPSNI